MARTLHWASNAAKQPGHKSQRGARSTVRGRLLLAACRPSLCESGGPETQPAGGLGCGSCRPRGKRRTVSRRPLENRQAGFPQLPQPRRLLADSFSLIDPPDSTRKRYRCADLLVRCRRRRPAPYARAPAGGCSSSCVGQLKATATVLWDSPPLRKWFWWRLRFSEVMRLGCGSACSGRRECGFGAWRRRRRGVGLRPV